MDLYVFDFDYTLINLDTSTAWCHYLAAHKIVADPEGFLAKERALMQAYDEGKMRVEDYISFSMGALSHLTVKEIDKLCSEYVNSVLPEHLFSQGKELIAQLKREGKRIIVISASAAFIVRKAAALLGLDEVLAVEVKQDGEHYLTEIEGLPPFKDGKVTALRKWQQEQGLEDAVVHFYTDSINDLPLCLAADKASVVNPGAELKAKALQNGYEILAWH